MSTEALLNRVAAAAEENNVWVGMGVGINDPFIKVEGLSKFTTVVLELGEEGMTGVESNRFMLFAPKSVGKDAFDEAINGLQLHENIRIDYRKRNPVDIIETPFGIEGNATVPIASADLLGDGNDVQVGSVVSFEGLGGGRGKGASGLQHYLEGLGGGGKEKGASSAPALLHLSLRQQLLSRAASLTRSANTNNYPQICFDMESPWHVRQLSKASVILNPSYDWPGLNPYHARIVAFRAIETGTSIYHHCQAGTTAAVDYLGNMISMSDFFSDSGIDGKGQCVPHHPEQRCEPPVNVAQLPLKGVWTVYGLVGDVLPFACVLLTGGALAAVRGGKGKRD